MRKVLLEVYLAPHALNGADQFVRGDSFGAIGVGGGHGFIGWFLPGFIFSRLCPTLLDPRDLVRGGLNARLILFLGAAGPGALKMVVRDGAFLFFLENGGVCGQ